MADFVTTLHATFSPKLAKLPGHVEHAFFNENGDDKLQMT